jgi:hypothetical protein
MSKNKRPPGQMTLKKSLVPWDRTKLPKRGFSGLKVGLFEIE